MMKLYEEAQRKLLIMREEEEEEEEDEESPGFWSWEKSRSYIDQVLSLRTKGGGGGGGGGKSVWRNPTPRALITHPIPFNTFSHHTTPVFLDSYYS